MGVSLPRPRMSMITEQHSALEVQFAGMRLRTPLVTASGTFGYGREYIDKLTPPNEDRNAWLASLGAITLKSVTLRPREGNPPDRTVETYAGLVNSIGIQNVGVERLVEEYLPALRELDVRIIVSIAGSTVDEYEQVAEVLARDLESRPDDFDAVELNISCPNVKEGGIEFGGTCEGTAAVVRAAARHIRTKPVIAKLTPNVPNIGEIAIAAVEAGASGLCLINTVSALVLDYRSRRSMIGGLYGGLSGPAIKPVGLHRVNQAYRALYAAGLDVPIVGMGGVSTWEYAIEYVIAGATAVGIGTALFYNPLVCQQVAAGMTQFVAAEVDAGRIRRYEDLIGSLETQDGQRLCPPRRTS